jgi:hypothetical protein
LPHAVAAAQKGDFGAALVYQMVHDALADKPCQG